MGHPVNKDGGVMFTAYEAHRVPILQLVIAVIYKYIKHTHCRTSGG